jgi:hypothetical protein
MAINWMDNFNIYGTDAGRNARLLDGIYAETTRSALVVDPDPNAGGGMVMQKFGGGLGGDLRKVLLNARTTVGALGRFWFTNLPTAPGIAECPTLFSFRDLNNVTHVNVTIDPVGNIVVNRIDGAATVQIGITPNPVLTANAWKHVEAKAFIDPANGTVEVRVEGVTIINIGPLRTTNNAGGTVNSCQQIAQQSCQDGAGPTMYMKDYIIWDNTTAFNNNFMGSCQVLKTIPDADVALNWAPTPADGIGFDKINEVTPDDDTRYIAAAAPLPTPANGALSATASGALGATTYYVRSTWVNATGETLPAPENSLAVLANNVLNVAAPPTPPFGATGWNVYVSTAAGTETKQNGGVPIGIAAAWVEPNTGLVAGAALPGANTTTFPAAYKCSISDLPITVTSVRGIMPIHRSRKTDGGDGNMQLGVISAAATGLGSNRPITTAYTYWYDIFDADPNGAAAWTRISFNAINLQLNRTV